MSKERACPRRPSAPPGEMLQGTRSHFTCITSNRMIRVMVAMLTRWMISARATSTDSDGRLFFVIFISPRLYQCTMRQSSHGLASDLHSNLLPPWRRITRPRLKNDFRNLGMACSVGHWRRRQTQGVCRRSFCTCACDAVGLLL